MYKTGDWVVFLMSKFTAHPGPRAKDVEPTRHGELYRYDVEKYWVVVEVLPDQRIRVRTRRGKEHLVDQHDGRLRPARWWEKWFLRHRFPTLGGPKSDSALTGDDA
jgi:hypothetical protein